MAENNAAAIASLVVHVGLDKTALTQGLAAMKNTVRAATSEWKAQFSVFNQLGDHVAAAKAKYEGLTTSIEAQKKVVDQERSQLASMGQRTNENAASFDKLTAQINLNVNKLAGLTAQQEKAKKMYDYEQTGIRGNKEELTLLQREMQATVNMYKAQGDEEKASAAQAEGLRSQIKQLTEIRGKEAAILEKVKNESGESSREYREQAIRVKELSGQVGHAESELRGLGDSAEKSAGMMARLKDRASSTHDIFKGSFLGSLAGNVMVSAIGRLTSGVHNIISAGKEENATLESVNLTWKNVLGNDKQAERFTKVIEEMHEQSHYSLQSVSALDKMMYKLTGNQKGMEDLSSSIMHIGRAAGLNDTQITQIGKRLAQVGVTGKITYSDVAKMSRQVPGFAAAMAQSMGVPAAKLVEMGKKGKLTGKDFQDTIMAMGKANEKSYTNYEHTTAGFSQAMHDTWDKLSARLMKPIFNMNKSGLASLTKFAQSKDVERAFTSAGEVMSKAMGKASQGVERLIKYIQSHKKDISAVVDEIRGSLVSMWKIAEPVLNFLITHPKILIGAASGLLAVSGAMKAIAIGSAIAKIGITGMKTALISSGIGAVVVLLGIAAVELITHWKEVKKFFAGLGKWFAGIWHDVTSGVSHFVGGVKDKWDGMVSGAKSKFASMANGAKDKFNDMRKWSTDATNKMVDQVTDKHSWLNKHTNGAASTMFSGLKKTFKNGYNTMHDYTNTWSDIIHGRWSKVGGDIGKTAKSAMKTARSAFQTGYNTLNKLTGGRLGDLVDSVKSHASSMVSTFKKLPGRMADGIRNGYDAIKDAAVHIGNGLISGIAKGVNGVIGGIDWVLDKVHAPKIPKWKPKYFAQGGDALGLSVVGEKGKHELIKYPDGRIEVSPNKATLYNFKQPVKILGGDKTEQLMKLKVIPKYGLGNWIGDAVDFVKGGFSAVSKGASSFWKAITHPKELLNTAIDKFTDLSGLQGTVLDMAKGTVSTVADQALAWVKSKLELAGDPPGSGVERWRPYVVRALAMNDLSTSKGMVEKVLRQIKTESGGNAKAVQHGYTDVNTLSGDLAKGLMQTISATFNANKFSGHGDIFNGFDNLLAALHYAKNRYGASLSALGKGHGYANGGIVTTEQMAHIAEGNKAEMVIPLTNQNRALQLMYQALDYFKGNDSGSGSQKQLGGDNSILTDLLTKLLTATLQQNQILATELGKTPIVQISISDIMHAAAQYTSRKRAF